MFRFMKDLNKKRSTYTDEEKHNELESLPEIIIVQIAKRENEND